MNKVPMAVYFIAAARLGHVALLKVREGRARAWARWEVALSSTAMVMHGIINDNIYGTPNQLRLARYRGYIHLECTGSPHHIDLHGCR